MREKSSFLLVFGESPVIKVIDYLLDNQELDYSLTDIAKGADIGWSTLHLFWPDFIKIGLVTKTRRIGRAVLFKLNKNNPLVQKLVDLDLFISKQFIEKEIKKQRVIA